MIRTTSTLIRTFGIAALLTAALGIGAPAMADPPRHDSHRSQSGRPGSGDHDRGRHDSRGSSHGSSHGSRGGFSFNIQFGQPAHPSGGYYTTRAVQVCVVPAHYERRWIEPVTCVGYDHCGRPVTRIITPGYYTTCYVPARHETRYERVWVPYGSSCRR
jgi:hypothetical protein